MHIALSETERARLRRMVKRPRSRRQSYRARALLALDEGQPAEAVARTFKVGMERVEGWAEGFARLRLKYLAEPAGPSPKRRWNVPGEDEEGGGLGPL